MAEVVPITFEMTRSVLRLPYFLDPALDELAAQQPEQLLPTVLGERQVVHDGVARLIEEERRREQWLAEVRKQPPPNEPWEFTANRRDYLLRRQPLAVRQLACRLMSIINAERLDDEGQPLNDEVAQHTPYLHADELLRGHDADPRAVAAHLKRAGYYRTLDTTSTRLHQIEYPTDALAFLEQYPALVPNEAGERTRSNMANRAHISDGWGIDILYQHDLFPIPRLGLKGREYEFYSVADQAVFAKAVAAVPHVGKDEVPVPEVLARLNGGDKLGDTFLRQALKDSGLPISLRRNEGFGSGGLVNVLTREDVPRFSEYVARITTKQPGEMDQEEIVAVSGVTASSVNRSIFPHDKRHTRQVFLSATSCWRTVYSPPITQAIIRRARVNKLPPHILTDSWIFQRFAQLSDVTIHNRLKALPNDPIHIKLQFPVKPKVLLARTFNELQALEELLPVSDNAEKVCWDMVPRGPFDTDPERLAYGRHLQSLHSPSEHIEDTPIDQWVQQANESLAAFARAAPPQGRALLPLIPLVVKPPAKQVPYVPKSRPPRPSRPPGLPRYSWRSALVWLRRPDVPGLSIGDICFVTGAPQEEVEVIATDYEQKFGKPIDATVDGQPSRRYDGPHLDTILIELVGLNVPQMALRLGVEEIAVSTFLRQQGLKPTPDGRYSAHSWAQVQQAFKHAAK